MLLISLKGMSQDQVFSGKLIDAESKNPIPFALIYINGTTISSTSDENGDFEIKISILPAQLEVSHLSYQPVSIAFKQIPEERAIIEITAKDIVLREVTIVDKNLRQEFVEIFQREFLGIDTWGLSAKLLNDEVLMFEENKDYFRAFAIEPIKVSLPKLGYEVQVELMDFVVEKSNRYNRRTTRFTAKYFFQDVDKVRNRHCKNRLKVYYNSSQHFYRSLYHHDLPKNGFNIFEEVEDSVNHIKRYVPVDTQNTLAEKDGYKEVNLQDKTIHIFYYPKINTYEPRNLEKQKPGALYLHSTVYFEKDSIPIYPDGTSPSNFFIFGGAISDKKVGATLPNDYNPEECK